MLGGIGADFSLSLSRLLSLSPVSSLTRAQVHRQLVRMLTNILYVSRKLDVKTLQLVCGIDVIVEHYTRARSAEARDNLFCILFDWAVHQQTSRRAYVEKQKQIGVAFRLLRYIEAPQLFPQLFKYAPSHVVIDQVRGGALSALPSPSLLSLCHVVYVPTLTPPRP